MVEMLPAYSVSALQHRAAERESRPSGKESGLGLTQLVKLDLGSQSTTSQWVLPLEQ